MRTTWTITQWVAGLAIAVAATPQRCHGPKQSSPPPVEPADLVLLEAFWPSPAVKKELGELGYETLAHITQKRFWNNHTQMYDAARYKRFIWTPNDESAVPQAFGSAERYGIPPGYDGWVLLDFEKWDPLIGPAEFEEETVRRRVREYTDLIAATRRLRPKAKICWYGLVRGPLDGRSGELIEQIVRLADGIGVSMFSNLRQDYGNLDHQNDIHQSRLKACLALKKKYGLKVFPVLSKRHNVKVGRGILRDEAGTPIRMIPPPNVQRRIIATALSIEHQGMRADGVILWWKDNGLLATQTDLDTIPDTPDQAAADRSDVEFARMISEVAAKR